MRLLGWSNATQTIMIFPSLIFASASTQSGIGCVAPERTTQFIRTSGPPCASSHSRKDIFLGSFRSSLETPMSWTTEIILSNRAISTGEMGVTCWGHAVSQVEVQNSAMVAIFILPLLELTLTPKLMLGSLT